jgi:hypothetical protein
MSWLYIGKKLCPVQKRKFSWQSFIVPIVPAIAYGLIATLWLVHVFPPIEAVFTGLFFFFPMFSLFGGWDDNTLAVFKEAVEISGPSKTFFMPILKVSMFITKTSPLHGMFPIPHEQAKQEALELMKMRHIKDILVKELRAA